MKFETLRVRDGHNDSRDNLILKLDIRKLYPRELHSQGLRVNKVSKYYGLKDQNQETGN